MITPLNIDSAFDGFMDKCYPADVPAVQYDESRKVWFAGMHALLCHMRTFGSDEYGGDAELERLLKETAAFGDLQSGKGLE